MARTGHPAPARHEVTAPERHAQCRAWPKPVCQRFRPIEPLALFPADGDQRLGQFQHRLHVGDTGIVHPVKSRGDRLDDRDAIGAGILLLCGFGIVVLLTGVITIRAEFTLTIHAV